MSGSNALSIVTSSLKDRLHAALDGNNDNVTAKSPSIARNGNTGEQINIFLYGVHYNPAFRNEPMRRETRNGEKAYPPLPLVLKYLVTVYDANSGDLTAEKLMGRVMLLLHDNPLLNPSSDIQQIERIRITPDPLSLDDMSKLWSSFQSAGYHLSTGYEVSVVLIESIRTGKAALPVIKRGEDDRGADIVATASSTLLGLRFPHQKPSAELGDTITLLGENLSNENTTVRFKHPNLELPFTIQSEPNENDAEMLVKLPSATNLGSKWLAGFYEVTLKTKHADKPTEWTSNTISMPLSPSIEKITPNEHDAGSFRLSIECLPKIIKEQSVKLLFGDQVISADPAVGSTLTFNLIKIVKHDSPYVVRLRVDGVDSIPVDFSGNTPQFADNQKVTIL